MHLSLALIAALAAAMFALLSASTPKSEAGMVPFASFHDCGTLEGGFHTSNIETVRVRCSKARRVVRSFLRQARRDGNFDREVRGFHCKKLGFFGVGGGYRCAASGQRVIRFTTGR
jgi:hypothetical protein